ncbi:ATP-binding protein [Flavimaricola marinus]|uniref:Proteasome-associated ATPase n=1 Tax=Flavimaricola marinus TaxID=1819565 RepID=A0A238L9C0_9RHOB|nr:ATP-binding protein [Flavimaricola marinus]SMY06268.1 Proteasome-associated ATPase [Flavimaricola marinus]
MMDGARTLDWGAGNAEILSLEFRRLAALLNGEDAEGLRAPTQIEVIEARMTAPSAIARIARAFGLGDDMRQTLLLAALADAPPSLSGALQKHRFAAEGRATPAVVADLLGHTETLRPDGALRTGRLIRLDGSGRFYERPMIVPDAVREALGGHGGFDAVIEGRLRPVTLAAAPSDETTRIAGCWASACRERQPPVLFSDAGDPAMMLARFAAAVRGSGQSAWVLPAEAIPADPGDRAEFGAILRRDLILNDIALAILGAEAPQAAWSLAEALGLPCLILGAAPPATATGPALRLSDGASDPSAWSVLLDAETCAHPDVREAAQSVALTVPQVRRAVAATAAGLAPNLMAAARAEVGEQMGHLAQRIGGGSAWEDLILPPAQHDALTQMSAFLGNRDRVLSEWGFAGKSSRGLGMAALFHGQSGTGKTTAAEALVGRMQSTSGDAVPLYRVNVAALVSKYIGETAKNFEAVFKAGEAMGAALLFDEADGLFGKRTGSVKDSIDKHSNAELGFLLQCLEAYPGVAILTTNMRASIDDAFFRRFRFAIEFPFPDQALRRQIWQRVLPDALPREGLDFDALSGPSLSGGSIRSVAINGAYMAASEDQPLQMRHLAHAVRLEYAKLEKTAPDKDLKGWL